MTLPCACLYRALATESRDSRDPQELLHVLAIEAVLGLLINVLSALIGLFLGDPETNNTGKPPSVVPEIPGSFE